MSIPFDDIQKATFVLLCYVYEATDAEKFSLDSIFNKLDVLMGLHFYSPISEAASARSPFLVILASRRWEDVDKMLAAAVEQRIFAYVKGRALLLDWTASPAR